MPWSAKLNESAKLCSHLQTCYANIDTITCDFPQYFNESDDVVDDNENGNFGEDINTEDDGSLGSELESNFDKETGQESYVEEGTSKLYTRIGVAHIKYFGLKCPRNMCDKKFVDASGTWGMFFYTSTTCAGDEIRWDFIHAVKTSKISFTGFCNEMTRVYKTKHTNGDPFMSVKTFIGWFLLVALCIQNRFP